MFVKRLAKAPRIYFLPDVFDKLVKGDHAVVFAASAALAVGVFLLFGIFSIYTAYI